jgi:hypothetical protein
VHEPLFAPASLVLVGIARRRALRSSLCALSEEAALARIRNENAKTEKDLGTQMAIWETRLVNDYHASLRTGTLGNAQFSFLCLNGKTRWIVEGYTKVDLTGASCSPSISPRVERGSHAMSHDQHFAPLSGETKLTARHRFSAVPRD